MNEKELEKVNTIDYPTVDEKINMIRKESLSYIDGIVNDLKN